MKPLNTKEQKHTQTGDNNNNKYNTRNKETKQHRIEYPKRIFLAALDFFHNADCT